MSHTLVGILQPKYHHSYPNYGYTPRKTTILCLYLDLAEKITKRPKLVGVGIWGLPSAIMDVGEVSCWC